MTDIGVEETKMILEKLIEKSWINIDTTRHALYLINYKQLANLAAKI